MVVTLELRATQDGVIWPRRPLVSSKGLLSCLQNVPHSTYDRKPTRFRAVAFNAAGDGFAAADEKGRVFVFFVTNNRYSLVQHLGAPTVACCFSPTRKSELLVTCENEMIRCIDVQSQSLISSLRGHSFPARSASFQKSGNLALTASQDAVILWDTQDWSRYRVLNAGPGVEEAAFVTKGDLVAVCFQDDSIMMWELESLALRYRFSLPPQEKPAGINKTAVSEDYKVLVATGRSRFIYVWDFEAQTIIRIIELPAPIEDVVTFMFVPGQESTICLLGNEGSLFFLNVAAKKPKIKLEISNPGRKIVAFDIENHGRYLVACTEDGCLLLYDMDIANDTARRAHAHRMQQGLQELEENMRLRTRSVITTGGATPASAAATRYHEEEDGERPATSKLIDGIFGMKAKREKEIVVPEQRIEFQDKRSTRVSPRRVLSPHTPVIATPVKPFDLPRSQAAGRPATKQKSVLQMTSLSSEEIEVNRKRLKSSLDCNGKYPAKYRLLVWKFLLQLPRNESAFKALLAKGPHPAFMKLHEQYPLRNQRQLRRLHRVLSAIAYWCPAFGEVSYLPAVVYPFIKVYRENDIAAFEASLSVLLHWGRDFLVSLPYAPVFLLSKIEAELEKIDPQLHDHFVKHDISPEVYAWSLLKSIFTEVLSEDEWMVLWDHLLTASGRPDMLRVGVLAYVSYFRTALLAAKDHYSIEQFFHQQNALQIHAFVQLLKNISGKLGNQKLDSISQSTEATGSYWPLPKGQYPAFANYPKFIVDFQISERNRIALEEAEIVQKKKLLKRVVNESEKLQAEHQRWLRQREALLAAEEKRRTEMLAEEKARILNLKSLDHETRKRRLDRLAELEKAAKETLEQTSTLFQAEYLRLESELGMLKERAEFEVSSRRQEEELQRMEYETEKRVADIHRQREIEERLQQLRSEFVTRIKQDELQDILLFERWKRDDEAQRLKAKAEIEAREKQALLQQERTIRQQLENRLLDHILEKEQHMLDLQMQRDARVQEERTTQRVATDFDIQGHELARELGAVQETRREARRMRATSQTPSHTHRGNTQSEEARQSQSRQYADVSESLSPHTKTLKRVQQHDVTAGHSAQEVRRPDQEEEEKEEFDVGAGVTNESIRLLDTARRRLSSVLHQSNDDDASSSSNASSFATPPVVRTKEELSLLEKALADISSSSGSSSGEHTPSSHHSETSASRHELFGGISPIHSMRTNPSISLPNATALLRDESIASVQAVVQRESQGVGQQAKQSSLPRADASGPSRQASHLSMSMPSLSSDEGSEEASSMLQRPIEELEKELGIRFDDLSEEEKDESDESDDELEDDRAQLLLRAKNLLAEQSLVSYDEADEDGDDGEEDADSGDDQPR